MDTDYRLDELRPTPVQLDGALSALMRAAGRGALAKADIATSYQRILALKAKIAG